VGDLLPSEFPDSDVEGERRLMYVALTRPEDMLFITCSMDSAFIRDIRNTGKVGLLLYWRLQYQSHGLGAGLGGFPFA